MKVCFSTKNAFISAITIILIVLLANSANALAQGLTLSPVQGSNLYTADNVTVTLIAIRLILVLGLMIAAYVAYFSGHNWLHAEGNTKKAKVNKEKLAKALLVITVLFFALILYRVFVPDYHVLAL